MNANTETEPARIILITVPKDELSCINGERSVYVKNPKMMTAKLAIRKFLAALEFQDNPIAPKAASTVIASASNRKSAASERAVASSETKPAYTMSSNTSPNEIAASQAYSPTKKGLNILVDMFRGLSVSLI